MPLRADGAQRGDAGGFLGRAHNQGMARLAPIGFVFFEFEPRTEPSRAPSAGPPKKNGFREWAGLPGRRRPRGRRAPRATRRWVGTGPHTPPNGAAAPDCDLAID